MYAESSAPAAPGAFGPASVKETDAATLRPAASPIKKNQPWSAFLVYKGTIF